MNRRRLIFTVLGALGATAIAPVAQVVASFPPTATTKIPTAELFVSVSADVSAALAQALPAIGTGFIGGVKVATDFEHQMSGVKAVMSTDEIQQFGEALNRLALQLGRDTTFSSREAAAGIEELIKAGVPAEAVLAGGPLIIISSEAEADAFLARMAEAIAGASGRQRRG